MASLRGASDLVTELRSIDFSGLTNYGPAGDFNDRPIVRTAGGTDAGGDAGAGEIIILDESYNENIIGRFHDETWVMEATYSMIKSYTTLTNFYEVLEAIAGHLKNLNDTQSGEYDEYRMTYVNDTNVTNPVATIIFTLIKELQVG